MITRVVSAFVTAIVLCAGAVRAQVPATPDDSGRAARVDAVFKDFDTQLSPGCAVAVYQGDRIVYQRAYGMANLDHDVPLSPRSVFHVASVSKQFTATAILLLAQAGTIDLDDDVRRHVPELPDLSHRITIRHLIHHTSGIRDQWALLGLAGWRYSRDLITDDDVLELLSRQRGLNFAPGERFLYSNSGYTLLAIIVSRASGQSFREFTTERIFKPLGMANTHFRDAFTEVVKHQAYGYAREGDTFRLSVTNFDTAGATSLLTTVEDLARWNFNFEKPTVGDATLIARLTERGTLADKTSIDYASGLSHGVYRGQPTVGHGGADAGYRADFVRFPAQRFGVACACNLASANPGELSRKVADVFLSDVLDSAPTLTASEEVEVPLPPAQLATYAGLYWNQTEANAMRVALEEDRLVTTAGTQRFPLKSIGGGRFVPASGPGPRLAFVTDAGGGARLRIGPDGSPTAPVYERVDPFVPKTLDEFAGVYRSDEMDAVYRVVLTNGVLTLHRSKSRPAPMEPLVVDTFGGSPGTFRFVRDSRNHVNGFVLDAGRVRHVKFSKDPTANRETRLP